MNKHIAALMLAALLLPLDSNAADSAPESLLVGLHNSCQGGSPAEGLEALGGIGLVLGKVVISGVVDWIGAMATAQGQNKIYDIGEGTGHGQFYRVTDDGKIKRNVGCVWVLRPGHGGATGGADGAKVLDRLRTMLADNPGPISDVPDFYAEFDIDTLPDRKDVFALRVLSVYLGHSGFSSWSDKERDLTMALSLYYPDQPKTPFASTAFNFAKIPQGKFISREDNALLSMSSGWMTVPSLENGDKPYVSAANALAAWQVGGKTEAPPVVSVKSLGLVNVKAAVKETQQGSQFWAAVASAYGSQKAELKTAIGNQLIPSERREQEVTSANAADDLYVTYVAAKLEVEEAQDKLAKLASSASAIEKIRAQTAVTKAQIAANQAARSADVALPYPSVYK